MSIKNELIPKRRFKEFENADAWEQRKLGEIVLSEIKGSAKAEMIGGDTPYLETNYLNGGECLFVDSENNVDTDDVIVLWDGSQAGTVYHGFSGALGSTFKAYKTKCLGLFIFQQLKKNQQTIYDKYRTPNIPHVIKTFKDEYDVMLTSEEEQNEIGRYFQQIDHLITLHQRKLDKLKETKIAYISEMFPKEGNLKPERRFKGYKNEWESINLEQIATMNARIGWQNLRTSEFLKEGDYMLITGTDFENGKVDFSTCHFVSKERYEQDTNIQVQNGSILITKDGTLGKVAYVEDLEKPATLNAGVFNVRIKDQNKVDEVFLFQYLRAPFLMRYVNERATGGTIKHLNQNILVKFPILLPEKEEQIRIGKFLTKLDKMIESQQRVLSKLIDLKNAYLNEMFV